MTRGQPLDTPLRVLYVEDDRINALLFEETLKVHAAMLGTTELRVAEDGAQALSVARSWMPDVLVIDANLPDAHGIEMARQARTALHGKARRLVEDKHIVVLVEEDRAQEIGVAVT